MVRLFAVIAVFILAVSAFAQDQKKDDKNVLELPEFVITGAGSVGIQSVHKQQVKDVWMLDSASRALLRPVVGTVAGSATRDSITLARTYTMLPLVVHG